LADDEDMRGLQEEEEEGGEVGRRGRTSLGRAGGDTTGGLSRRRRTVRTSAVCDEVVVGGKGA